MPEALNAVIYARYSSDRQTEQSIEGQLRECYAFANTIVKSDIRNFTSVCTLWLFKSWFSNRISICNKPLSRYQEHFWR